MGLYEGGPSHHSRLLGCLQSSRERPRHHRQGGRMSHGLYLTRASHGWAPPHVAWRWHPSRAPCRAAPARPPRRRSTGGIPVASRNSLRNRSGWRRRRASSLRCLPTRCSRLGPVRTHLQRTALGTLMGRRLSASGRPGKGQQNCAARMRWCRLGLCTCPSAPIRPISAARHAAREFSPNRLLACMCGLNWPPILPNYWRYQSN